jgi:hypothetical protein
MAGLFVPQERWRQFSPSAGEVALRAEAGLLKMRNAQALTAGALVA